MKRNDLIFESAKRVCSKKKGEGQIVNVLSNKRWCSDCFEIKCFNGERVYVSFIMDCHDRQCLSYVAKSSPLLSIDIQDLMLRAVESRFGVMLRVPVCKIELLTDRGFVYRSKKTIKRDYVYTSNCASAESVCKMLKNWIFDYNNVAPHSGLGMKSPVEYRKFANPRV